MKKLLLLALLPLVLLGAAFQPSGAAEEGRKVKIKIVNPRPVTVIKIRR